MNKANAAENLPTNPAERKRGFFSARFMRRLSIGTKLWITTGILCVPLLWLLGMYVHSLASTLWFTKTEQRGYLLFQPLDQVAQRVVRREELATTALARKSNAEVQLTHLDEELDAKLADFEALEAKQGDATTHGLAKELHEQWDALKAAKPKTPQDCMATHEHLLDAVSALSAQITADAKLTLDPEATAYNLVDVTIAKVPEARRFLTEARAHMAAMYAGTEYVPAEGARVASLIAMFGDRVASARNELKLAAAAATDQPEVALQIGELGNDWDNGIGSWSAEATRELASGHPAEDAIRTLLNSSAKYSQSLNSIQDAVQNTASTALGLRYTSQVRCGIAALVCTAFPILAAILLMLALARRIAGAVARLLHITGRIFEGDYGSCIDASGTDEISRLFAQIKKMQTSLFGREAGSGRLAPAPVQLETEVLTEESVTNGRIRAALDAVSGCVMVADTEGKIVYSNAAVTELLRRAESDIRKQLPSFSASAVLGADFEIFHRRPQQQRQMLAALTRPHVAQIELGGRTFRLILNPVNSTAGNRLGTAVEWTDRTLELAAENEMSDLLKAVLGGDLAHRVDLAGKSGFFEGLGRGMNRLIDNLQEIIVKVKRTSGDMQSAAQEIAVGNANLSQRIEQQSASLEQTAASMEQITATVKQNADNAHQANQLASAAREQAQAGGTVVNQAITAMADINDSSKKIANIIGVIDEIAFQTNLLALNAAVEAARAGEQGRGFAVVASEVRNLAGRSAGAAKEIKELIRDSVGKVAGGTELVTQSGKTLEQIVIAVKKVTDVVAEIASASSEQTRGIEQVNVAITHMDQMTQQNTALIEQTTAASQGMAQRVEELTSLLNIYQTGAAARPAAASGGATQRAAKSNRGRATG